MKKQKLLKRLWSHRVLFLMMLPGIVYVFINNYIPMPGIIMAFKKYDYTKGIFGSPWYGLRNFKFMFSTKDAFLMIRNTLLYNAAFILLGLILSVTVAVVLNEIRSERAKKVYQIFILIPFLISMVIVSYIVYALLSTDTGFINSHLTHKKINYYMQPKYWPFILTIVNLWKGFGYSSVVYFATVIGIDSALYEAAAIDGANRWQRIVHITLPGLKSTIVILTLMSIGKIFYSDFGLFYQVPMFSGMLYNVTTTIDVYVYKALMTMNDYGRSGAAGMFQSVCGFILVLTTNWIVRKVDSDNALF